MNRRLALSLSLACGIAMAAPAAPALADGAASTRNILFGAAAAGAGTYLIVHHNAQVHQKYAAYDHQVAAEAAQRNNAEAAYASERQAYNHELTLVSEQQKELAFQHRVVESLRHQLAERSGNRPVRHVAQRRSASTVRVASRRPAAHDVVAQTTYGWGNF